MYSVLKKITLTFLFIFITVSNLYSEDEEPLINQVSYSSNQYSSNRGNVSTFTGSYSTSIPIKIPPAAGNIQEEINLVLNYSPSIKNGWFGRNWDCEIGFFEQTTKYGTNNKENPYAVKFNNYYSELTEIGTEDYRLKYDNFTKIHKSGSSKWFAWTPNGTQYTYELRRGKRLYLTKITNSKGISASFGYEVPTGSSTPRISKISYPEGNGLSPYCQINFSVEDRLDKNNVEYAYDKIFKYDKRINQITTTVSGHQYSKYILNYSTNGLNDNSFINSVFEYGKSSASYSHNYTYTVHPNYLSNKTLFYNSKNQIEITPKTKDRIKLTNPTFPERRRLLDLNNDGIYDEIRTQISSGKTTLYVRTGLTYNTFNKESAW